MLTEMGYVLCNSDDADVVIINTCAVRENAENRVRCYRSPGACKAQKSLQIIILLDVWAEKASVREKIKELQTC